MQTEDDMHIISYQCHNMEQTLLKFSKQQHTNTTFISSLQIMG